MSAVSRDPTKITTMLISSLPAPFTQGGDHANFAVASTLLFKPINSPPPGTTSRHASFRWEIYNDASPVSNL